MRWTVLLACVGLLLAGAPLAGAPLAGAALAAASTTSARIAAARAVIARCAKQAGERVRGLEALRARCPGIGEAVEALDLGPNLPAHWQREASAQALSGLVGLAARYARPAPASALSAPELQRIALALAPAPPSPPWWRRLERFIGARLSRWIAPVTVGSQGWQRLLRALSDPRVALGLLATVGGLLLIAIALAILRALEPARRAYQGWRSRRGATGSESAVEGGTATRSAGKAAADTIDLASVASVARADRRERPVLLLRILVQALNASHRIARERSLSCRELIAAGRFDSERQRARFGVIALQAERALYGGPQLEAALPECELSDAEALRAELLQMPSTSHRPDPGPDERVRA